jgi:hypothetical protein
MAFVLTSRARFRNRPLEEWCQLIASEWCNSDELVKKREMAAPLQKGLDGTHCLTKRKALPSCGREQGLGLSEPPDRGGEPRS